MGDRVSYRRTLLIIVIALLFCLNTVLIPSIVSQGILDVENVESMRRINEKTVVVPYGRLYYDRGEEPDTASRFYPLIATPLAVYYEDNNKQHIAPLLVIDEENPSKPVNRFLEIFGDEDIYFMPDGDVEVVSREIAKEFWDKAETMLVVENSDRGYELALMATPIASYLDIPVVVGAPDEELIKKLNCGQVILIGSKIEAPAHVSYTRLVDREEIISFLLGVMKKVFGRVEYIVMTNPLDAKPIHVINREVILNVSGFDEAKPFGQCHPLNRLFNYTVLDGNQIIRFHLTFNLPRNEEQLIPTGEGFHILFYDQKHVNIDTNPLSDNSSLFYTDTNAYDHGEGYYEIDIHDNPGEYHIRLLSYGKQDKNWSLVVTAEEIDTDIRPQAPYLSTLAPYLASCRRGLVIADSNFSRNIAGKTGDINRRFDVALNEAALEAACKDNLYADNVLDEILEMMKEENLYHQYLEETPYLAVLADNNMLPMYYYSSETPRQHYSFEGLRQPSDNLLADIDGDGYNLSSQLELAVGRIMSWDAQDASALIARTLFYDDIVDEFQGLEGKEWRRSVTMVMGLALQERMIVDSRMKYMQTKDVFKENGYKIHSMTNGFHNIENIKKLFRDMMHSNLIWNEGHGRYYRYEYFFPPSIATIFYSKVFLKLFYPKKQQSQYAVCNVKDMEFGPSTMGITACIAGLTDGVPLRCTNIMATLHAGVNAIFVNTRCPSGPLSNIYAIEALLLKGETCYYYDDLMHLWFKEIVRNNNSVGVACRNAKNIFAEHYSNSILWHLLLKINPREYNRACEDFVHYNLFADSAFNPS